MNKVETINNLIEDLDKRIEQFEACKITLIELKEKYTKEVRE